MQVEGGGGRFLIGQGGIEAQIIIIVAYSAQCAQLVHNKNNFYSNF